MADPLLALIMGHLTSIAQGRRARRSWNLEPKSRRRLILATNPLPNRFKLGLFFSPIHGAPAGIVPDLARAFEKSYQISRILRASKDDTPVEVDGQLLSRILPPGEAERNCIRSVPYQFRILDPEVRYWYILGGWRIASHIMYPGMINKKDIDLSAYFHLVIRFVEDLIWKIRYILGVFFTQY